MSRIQRSSNWDHSNFAIFWICLLFPRRLPWGAFDLVEKSISQLSDSGNSRTAEETHTLPSSTPTMCSSDRLLVPSQTPGTQRSSMHPPFGTWRKAEASVRTRQKCQRVVTQMIAHANVWLTLHMQMIALGQKLQHNCGHVSEFTCLICRCESHQVAPSYRAKHTLSAGATHHV